MNPNHVRRSYPVTQQNNPQHYADSRMTSNPQPIPQNPGLNAIQRAGTPTARSYGFSPAQSPQQHGQYNVTTAYPASGMPPSDMNAPFSSGGPGQTTVKSNGQYANHWPGQRIQYAPSQPQQVSQSYTVGTSPAKFSQPPSMQSAGHYSNFQQSQQPLMQNNSSQLYIMPSVRPPRYQPPSTHSGVTQVAGQLQSPYYQTQPPPQPFYPQSQMAPLTQYPQNFVEPVYQHSAQQPMQAPVVMQHQTPAQPLAPRKKGIIIRDPNTLADVTSDVLSPGMPQGESSAASTPQPVSVSTANATTPQERIAAQFAAQVAAMASESPDRSPAPAYLHVSPAQTESKLEATTKPHVYPAPIEHAARSGSPASMVPKGVDTSVPPPTIQRMPHNFAPQATPAAPSSVQAPPSQTKSNGTVGNSKGELQSTTGASVTPMPPPANSAPLNNTRPDAPVAVVQPVRNEAHVKQDNGDVSEGEKRSVEIAIKHEVPTDKKIEEIISTAKAISKLEDSKHEVIINDIVTTKNTVETTEKSSKNVDSQPVSVIDTKSEGLKASPESESCDADSKALSNGNARTENADSKSSSRDEKEVVESTKNELEEAKDDALPSDNQPASTVVAEKISPPLQEDSALPTETPKDEAVVQVKITNKVEPESEGTKKSVDEFALKAMSGDFAVVENGSKAPVVQVKPEPVASVQVAKSSVSKNPPLAEPLPIQPSQNVSPEEPVFKIPKEIEKVKKAEPAKTEPLKEELDSANPSKKVYDRTFLMQFRYNEASLNKPNDLPIIQDIIMDRPLPKSSVSNSLPSLSMDMQRGTDFTPQWMGGGGGHRPGRNTSRGSRGGYGGGYPHQGSQSMPKIIKKVSIQKEPELNKAENAWKPSKAEPKSSGSSSTEEDQTAEVLRNVRSILNKLTPSKFSALMQKFQQLPINSEIRLREVINLIFEKAIDEPNFCEAYANMCRTMSQFRVQTPSSTTQNPSSQAGTTVEFRKILLTRCQREFEKDRANEDFLLGLRKKMEGAKTPEETTQFKEELDVAEAKERRRMLGNIRFIGELFKLNMLTESIMHNCIMTLFKSREEESLESLCRLLTTIGKDLDHSKGKQRMDQYFNQMEKIIRERKTSSRVRFMIQDVIDLRLNKWVQRAIKAQGPKTIDQIHADAKEEKEQHALQVAAAAAAPPMKSQSRGNRVGSRGGGGGHMVEEGWTKVGLQQKPIRYDPQKMKLSKQQFDESNVTLGPNRGKSGWKSGSGSSATKTGSGGYSNRDNMDNLAPRSSTPTMMNRFSALGSGSQDSYSPRGPGRISSQERNKSGSRGSAGSGGSRNSGRDERQSALDTVRRLTSIERKRASPVPPAGPVKPTAVAPPTAKPVLDEEQLVKKIKSTITEYLHLVDIKEATECFDELNKAPSQNYLIVKTCLEETLEKSSSHRSHIAQLLSHLVSVGKILPEQYVKGVVDNMELAIDVELDLPKVWSCLAELVAPIFYTTANKVQLAFLKQMAEPLLEEGKAASFVVEILKKLTDKMPLDTAVQFWQDSNLDIVDFFKRRDPSDVKEFLQRHNLEVFCGDKAGAADVSSPAEVTFLTYVDKLTKQLNMNKPHDEIFDWIEANVNKEERSKPIFVRAITTAACQKAIKQGDNKLEVDKSVIQSQSILLKKYVDDEPKELQAVYALQKLFVDMEQPPNILKLLFDYLYDEDVISEQTFFKWEEHEDPNEAEGKGVALLSVNPFFTWLREADVESDDN